MKVALFGNIRDQWSSLSMKRYADKLAPALTKLNVENHLIEPRLPFYFYLFDAKYRFRASRFDYYPKQAAKTKADLFHVLDHSNAQIASKLDPNRTVVTCHDLIPLYFEKDQFALKNFQESVGYLKKVRFVIADSKATKADLIRFLQIPEQKIRVIYLGVEKPGAVDPKEVAAFQQKHNLTTKPVLMHIGNNLPYKNLETLIASLSSLKNKGQNFTFVKVGEDFTPAQKKIITDLSLSPQIIYLGKVGESELPLLYSSIDVLVYPSVIEGFGFPTLEALSYGKPVVVSAGTSLEEVAGSTGFYIDPKSPDSIASGILEALKVDQSYSGKAVAQAARFNWESCAANVKEIYEEILK